MREAKAITIQTIKKTPFRISQTFKNLGVYGLTSCHSRMLAF
jgi:hypothetical protein